MECQQYETALLKEFQQIQRSNEKGRENSISIINDNETDQCFKDGTVNRVNPALDISEIEENSAKFFKRKDFRSKSCKRLSIIPEKLLTGLNKIPDIIPLPNKSKYGRKTIGQWGSFIYLINQIFGAGMLALPNVVKVSGWLPTLLSNILVCAVAMFASLMIMRCMTMIKGNQNFERRFEYIASVEYFLGKKFTFWTEVCFYLSIQSLNVVSIAIVSQSLDQLLVQIFGRTSGFTLIPKFKKFGFYHFKSQTEVDLFYSGKKQLEFGITIGYLITAIICIPLSVQNMDENMKIQYLSFTFLIISTLEIICHALYRIFHSNRLSDGIQASRFGVQSLGTRVKKTMDPSNVQHPVIVARPEIFGEFQFGKLFSTFIANYSYVNVIPSWANEMKESVRVNEAVWLSSGFSALAYYAFGFILAFAYADVQSDNVLSELIIDENLGLLTKMSIYVFYLLTVLPSILVYSITTRYNLLNSRKLSPRKAYLIGCICPFLCAWFFSNDNYFSALLQWSSLVLSLAVNFVIPSVVYIRACEVQRQARRNPTRHSESFRSYAKRTVSGLNSIMNEISRTMNEYLRSLPSEELDPYILHLVKQPGPHLESHSNWGQQYCENKENAKLRVGEDMCDARNLFPSYVKLKNSSLSSKIQLSNDHFTLGVRSGIKRDPQMDDVRCAGAMKPQKDASCREDGTLDVQEKSEIPNHEYLIENFESASPWKINESSSSVQLSDLVETSDENSSWNFVGLPSIAKVESDSCRAIHEKKINEARGKRKILPLLSLSVSNELEKSVSRSLEPSDSTILLARAKTENSFFSSYFEKRLFSAGSTKPFNGKNNVSGPAVSEALNMKRKIQWRKGFVEQERKYNPQSPDVTNIDEDPFGKMSDLYMTSGSSSLVKISQCGVGYANYPLKDSPGGGKSVICEQGNANTLILFKPNSDTGVPSITITKSSKQILAKDIPMNPLSRLASLEKNPKLGEQLGKYGMLNDSFFMGNAMHETLYSVKQPTGYPGISGLISKGKIASFPELYVRESKRKASISSTFQSSYKKLDSFPREILNRSMCRIASVDSAFLRKHTLEAKSLLTFSDKRHDRESRYNEITDAKSKWQTQRVREREETRRRNNFLAPPPLKLSEIPLEPPIEILTNPVSGAEDAYECDEEVDTGDLKPIRIHVYPEGPLRVHHVMTTKILMGMLSSFCLISGLSDVLHSIFFYMNT